MDSLGAAGFAKIAITTNKRDKAEGSKKNIEQRSPRKYGSQRTGDMGERGNDGPATTPPRKQRKETIVIEKRRRVVDLFAVEIGRKNREVGLVERERRRRDGSAERVRRGAKRMSTTECGKNLEQSPTTKANWEKESEMAVPEASRRGRWRQRRVRRRGVEGMSTECGKNFKQSATTKANWEKEGEMAVPEA